MSVALAAEIRVAVQEELRRSALGVLLRQMQGRLRWGLGSPEGVVEAPVSVLYAREDGTPGTLLYQKQSGTGNTGWAAIA
jgi:hypothetical protein